MSNPFDKNDSNLTSTEVVNSKKNENPIFQSTLLKRADNTPIEERLKKFPGEVDKLSNESGSHCGASPFEVTKQDHSKLNSANSLHQHLNKQTNSPNNGINQSISLSSNQQQSVSLEKNINTNNINNSNPTNTRKSSIDDENSFVTVPFSPPMRAFSLERTASNSELPYMNPDGNNNSTLATSGITNLTTSTDPLLNPGIDRSYYNMNSRIGSNIPLDDSNNQNLSTRVTTQVEANAENEDENEEGPMVNININPGTFAEPNGAEIPVVVRRRRNEDTVGVVVMICVILIIIGGCIAFLFI